MNSNLVILCLAILMQVTIQKRHQINHDQAADCKGVIFDAGSSGTRVYVYSWPCRTTPLTNPVIFVGQKAPDTKVTPGISTYGNNVPAVDAYLAPLIKFAKDNVAADKIKYTPIMLGATAGMRLLTNGQQESILTKVRKIFRESGFLFDNDDWARVITGKEEGAYLWLSANYILGLFNKENLDPKTKQVKSSYVTVDLGGASTQLAGSEPVIPAKVDEYDSDFVTSSIDIEFKLYSHSWLGYGQDQAREGLNKYLSVAFAMKDGFQNPCYQRGYKKAWAGDATKFVYGTGNPEACRDVVQIFLNKSPQYCDYKQCGIDDDYIPDTGMDAKIYAAGAIQFAKDNVGLPDIFTVKNLREEYDIFCSTEFSAEISAKNKYYESYCFLGIFAEQLLTYGYGIPSYAEVLSGSVNGLEPTWTLAAIFDQLDDIKGCPDSPACSINKYLKQLAVDLKNPDYEEVKKPSPESRMY